LRYIWLRRDNKVAQAISHYIAMRSGSWHRWVRDVPTRQGRTPEIPFDFAAIKDLVATAEAEDSGWRNFLADSGQQTLSLTYEELAADYAGTVARSLAFMGVTLPIQDIPPPAFHRQADARSLEWERRYREEAQEAQPAVSLARAQPG
jgi:trehalose 2-sulfotransferase